MRDNIFVMRIKTILSLIAFFATFVFSVSLIGLPKDNFYSRLTQINHSQQSRQNVRLLLLQDINNGRFRDGAISRSSIDSESYGLESVADLTEQYVDLSQSIDDENLPADFQMAWRAHMNAWRTHADFLNSVKEPSNEISSDVEVSDDNPFGLDSSDEQVYLNQVNEINRTWYQVLRVGRQYGVYVPVQ